jgi:hypothetical protein
MAFFRTRIQPPPEKLTNDIRMSDEDHLTLANVLAVLRGRLATVKISGSPCHFDMYYTVLFTGVSGSIAYKMLSEIHAVNQRLVNNVRLRAVTSHKNLENEPYPPQAELTLEVTFNYHAKTQLPTSSNRLPPSRHNLLLGYSLGAKEHNDLTMPEAFNQIPTDDRILLEKLVHIVHHMRDDLPLILMEFAEREIRDRQLVQHSSVYSKDSTAESRSNSSTSPMQVSESQEASAAISVVDTEYRLSFRNLDYIDSDFLDYFTQMVGSRITRLTVAPHMIVLPLASIDLSQSQEDDGHDGDTEEEDEACELTDASGCSRLSSTMSSSSNTKRSSGASKRTLAPPCIPAVRLTIYVQHVNAPIRQMYGVPDGSVTKSLVHRSAPTSLVTMRNLNVTAMWSQLAHKRKGMAPHTETDVETDTEGMHCAKRSGIR